MDNSEENITPGPFWVWVFTYEGKKTGELRDGSADWVDLSEYPELEDQQMYKITIEGSKIIKAEKRIPITPTREEIKEAWDEICEQTKDWEV